jgi:hypothetical protein
VAQQEAVREAVAPQGLLGDHHPQRPLHL